MKLYLVAISAIVVLFFMSHRGSAQTADSMGGLDASSQKALGETQDLLKNSTERNKAIQGDSKAQSADDFVKKLTGNNSKATDDIYALAADVFAAVVKDAKGDPKKMQEAMDKFMKDPAAFAETWTPEQKQRLKDLSTRMPAMSAPKN